MNWKFWETGVRKPYVNENLWFLLFVFFCFKVYNVLIHPITTSKALNYKYHLKIIDVGDVEVKRIHLKILVHEKNL